MFADRIVRNVLGEDFACELDSCGKLRVDDEFGGFSHGRHHPLPCCPSGSPVGRTAAGCVGNTQDPHNRASQAGPQPPGASAFFEGGTEEEEDDKREGETSGSRDRSRHAIHIEWFG